MTKDLTTINKVVVTRDLKRWIRVHLEWNLGITYSRNIRSCLKTKKKNSEYVEERGPTRIHTKVMVADHPKNKKMILGYHH